VRLEVVAQFPFGDQSSVHEFLDLGVASLGIGQDFTYKVHGTLHLEGMPLFFLFHDKYCANHLSHCRDVEQERLSIRQWDQD
jgi:hypothetical protein